MTEQLEKRGLRRPAKPAHKSTIVKQEDVQMLERSFTVRQKKTKKAGIVNVLSPQELLIGVDDEGPESESSY